MASKNIVRKEENTIYQHLFVYPQDFQTLKTVLHNDLSGFHFNFFISCLHYSSQDTATYFNHIDICRAPSINFSTPIFSCFHKNFRHIQRLLKMLLYNTEYIYMKTLQNQSKFWSLWMSISKYIQIPPWVHLTNFVLCPSMFNKIHHPNDIPF